MENLARSFKKSFNLENLFGGGGGGGRATNANTGSVSRQKIVLNDDFEYEDDDEDEDEDETQTTTQNWLEMFDAEMPPTGAVLREGMSWEKGLDLSFSEVNDRVDAEDWEESAFTIPDAEEGPADEIEFEK